MSRDAVIVGGGAMGSSAAYHLLALDPSMAVTVVERDPTYQRASTVLSDGNVRVQFNLEENILMSLYTMELLDYFANTMAVGERRPDPSPRRQGNLFMADAETREVALEGMRLQQALGGNVCWLDAGEIAAAYPPFSSERLVGGTFGPRDGSVDPNAVLRGYRAKAIDLGAEFIHGDVVSLRTGGGRISGVELRSGEEIRAETVLVAAGAWSTALAVTVGVELPVSPVMRTVYVVESPVDGGRRLPSVFLPSGLYVIPESDGTFLVAWSMPSDPVGYDFTPQSRSVFYDVLWPELIHHLPAFERLNVVGGWAGLYAVDELDDNAILGEWPGLGGLYLACGFSGHGFQHTPAMGRHIAELVLGRSPTLDLARLGPRRVILGEPLLENPGRII